MQFDDVFVVEDVISLSVLAVVDALSPDSCEFEFISQVSVYGGGEVHNGRACWEREGFVHIGFFPGRFCVDSYDI